MRGKLIWLSPALTVGLLLALLSTAVAQQAKSWETLVHSTVGQRWPALSPGTLYDGQGQSIYAWLEGHERTVWNDKA